MDTKTLIQMALDAGGSEFKTASGNDHARINHFFELTIDELEEFTRLVRKDMFNELTKI